MNLGSLASGDVRSESPVTSSRGSSPAPRFRRKTIEDAVLKNDKTLRRYAANIERALGTWEIAPEEWADYIAFLSRLQKAIQSGGTDAPTLPHSNAVASKLAQCLNPSLPSGVHQKALEVYTYIFSTFGESHVETRLHEYLPGLFPVLSFASLSVRPALYNLLENYIVRLSPAELRPVLKSFILSLLPALEDEASEDFDRVFTLVEKLQAVFVHHDSLVEETNYLSSYFWQSIFLSVMTSASRRQGALNYLARRLPDFSRVPTTKQNGSKPNVCLPCEAEAAISPEPGLLIRAFACGLSDQQTLIQRGFLDLLASNLPLSSPVLQERIEEVDFQLLMSAVTGVLLRRDMSLNRRIWQWLLGPESKDEGGDANNNVPRASIDADSPQQLQYFLTYGLPELRKCLLMAFERSTSRPQDRARAFRICLSLMDRWEIGGNIIPHIFLPALRSAYSFSMRASATETAELMKSASLFFDGVESKLIWSNLFQLVEQFLDPQPGNAEVFLWTIHNFNVKEEEMVVLHAPLVCLYLLNGLCIDQINKSSYNDSRMLDAVTAVFSIVPPRAFNQTPGNDDEARSTLLRTVPEVGSAITSFYQVESAPPSTSRRPYGPNVIAQLLSDRSVSILKQSLAGNSEDRTSKSAALLQAILHKMPSSQTIPLHDLFRDTRHHFQHISGTGVSFETLNALMSLLLNLPSLSKTGESEIYEGLLELEAHLCPLLWYHISPENAKFNLEAVKLLWRLDSFLQADEMVKASIHALLSDAEHTNKRKTVNNIRTFINLWNLSFLSQQSSAKTAAHGHAKRVSSFAVVPSTDVGLRRTQVLSSPLMVILDSLDDPSHPAFEDVKLWLNSSQCNENILRVLCEQLRAALRALDQAPSPLAGSKVERSHRQGTRTLIFVLVHFDNVLRIGNAAFWQALSDLPWPGGSQEAPKLAATVLAEHCLQMLPGPASTSPETARLAISILGHLMSAPPVTRPRLQHLNVTEVVLSKILETVTSNQAQLQAPMLRLAALSLKLPKVVSADDDGQNRQSGSLRRSSQPSSRPSLPEESGATQTVPVALLVQVLRSGFSSPVCYAYLDSWTDFLVEALPALGDSIASSLIPLTDTVCTQIQIVFKQLVAISTGAKHDRCFAPETTTSRLLDCLNMILNAAHDFLMRELMDATASQTESSTTMLGNVTPTFFKMQGPPSKTSKANNRLTVILASKDAVKTCIKIWMWASHGAEGAKIDPRSATTTSHNAMKLRNKTRHMLEEVFAVEPLESLEVVMSTWSEASTPAEKGAVVSVLHVLRGLRPKNTIPAILDSLCSRTNPNILVPSRQSTLTSDLTAADTVLFYSAYLEFLEDDALDEIWSDCTAFLRDILSNPLPYRQVLPALLWVTVQLAHKLDNTNYGEKKRMRRELGDNFQRLLAATFAALPSGFSDTATDNVEQETPFSAGLHDMNLVVILRDVVSRIETVMETGERASSCIQTISTSVISPLVRSKNFPTRLTADGLLLLQRISKKAPTSKYWRKDVMDAFNDPRFILSAASIVERRWFPVLQQWSLTDKERMTELFSRLNPPSSAGIMFGVGANAARLDADRKTQLNLRRISLLLLASPTDSHVEHLRTVEEKMVELFEATAVSSPSSAVKAELLMLCRALLLSTSSVHFAPFWPIINDSLSSALLALVPEGKQPVAQNNLSLLQACKLLDLLAALSPDEFQLHEWMYITNTTDAVYHASNWTPVALSDQLADELGHAQNEEGSGPVPTSTALSSPRDGRRGPMLGKGAGFDTEDVKAMAQDAFVINGLRPFLTQLSINTYESNYRMEDADVGMFRSALVEDLQDPGTMVS